MPTKWLQERAKGSKNEHGMPPPRAFCGWHGMQQHGMACKAEIELRSSGADRRPARACHRRVSPSLSRALPPPDVEEGSYLRLTDFAGFDLCSLIRSGKSTPPQNRSLILYYHKLKYKAGGFVRELTFKNLPTNTVHQIRTAGRPRRVSQL